MSRFVAITSFVAGALAVSCLDFTPLPYVAPSGTTPDASVHDAAADAPSTDAMTAACQACLSAGPCDTLYSNCEANSACAIFATCTSATSCWGSSLTDLTNLSPCILQCGVKAGFTSQTDPAALLVATLLTCAQDPTKCGTECAPGLNTED